MIKRRVAKLGGSLLTMPDVADRLRSWLRQQTPAQTLFVVGGGDFVEAMRTLDAVHAFDAEWCHWFCVELLEQSAMILNRLLPEMTQICTPAELYTLLQQREPTWALVHVKAFYDRVRQQDALPNTWETTSDSIAAHLARRTQADELVLFKSTAGANSLAHLPAEEHAQQLNRPDAQALAWFQAGIVDAAFAIAAQGIPSIRVVNLRES